MDAEGDEVKDVVPDYEGVDLEAELGGEAKEWRRRRHNWGGPSIRWSRDVVRSARQDRGMRLHLGTR